MRVHHLIRGHVSFDTSQKLIPHIPSNRLSCEDGTQKRICVSSSLEGCIAALGIVPCAVYALSELLKQQGRRATKQSLFRALRFPFTALEFEIDEKADFFVPASQIESLVPDACITNEAWLTKPIAPCSVSHLWLVGGTILRTPIYCDEAEQFVNQIQNAEWSTTNVPPASDFLDSLYTEVMDFLMYDAVQTPEYNLKKTMIGKTESA